MPFSWLTRGGSIRTRARTQSKRNSHTAEARTAHRLLAAAPAAPDRPNSRSSSTPQRRRRWRGGGGGQLRASEPPIVPVHDSRPCWLRVGVRERTRRANTKKAKVSTHYTQQKKQQQHNDYSQQQQIGPTALAEARGSDGGAAAGATSYERASLPSFA